jgi:uroporphyrin-3 C-methyltransferase
MMEHDITPTTPISVEPASARRSRWREALRRPALRVMLIALLLVAGLWVDMRVQIADMRQETSRRLATADNLAKENRLLAKQSQEALAAVQAKVSVLEARLAEMQGQSLSLQAMSDELSSRRDEHVLAEVVQAITLAMQQLQFAGNVELALMALQDAEARLANVAQPRFLPLRKLLIRDIARLKSMPDADITGLAFKIESVAAVAGELPLAFEQRPQAVTTPATSATSPISSSAISGAYWRGLVADLWNELHQLIRIERIERNAPVLLSPGQGVFLRENLKLRLLGARLALLQRDGKTFHEDLRQAQEMLERYFDRRAKPVAAALATVKALAATDVGLNLPSLNETLSVANGLKLARERGSVGK